MKPCPSCGSSVSSEAVSCPRCGHQFGPNLARMAVLGILLFLLIAVAGLILTEARINSQIGP